MSAPAAHAGTNPATCSGFIQKYFNDGPTGYIAAFTLVTQNILTKATYAEGSVGVFRTLFSSGVRGTGEQYFNDRQYWVTPPSNGSMFAPTPVPHPFDYQKTEQLQVNLGTSALSAEGLQFSITRNGQTQKVVPLGCLGVTQVYGIASGYGTDLVTVSLGKLEPPPSVPS
jgi:hypothetical protein